MEMKNVGTDNFKKFSIMLAEKLKSGFVIVEQNDTLPYAVLKKEGNKIDHILNFFICCLTLGLWSIVWVYITLVSSKAKTILIAIDEDGNTYEDKCF
jgi:hypothetical protein